MQRPTQGPHTRPIAETLGADNGLRQLLARAREAQQRLALVQRALPPALRPHVRSGSLDPEGWTLLVPNGAVAAKLRQCLPLVEQQLREQGYRPVPLRIKTLAAGR